MAYTGQLTDMGCCLRFTDQNLQRCSSRGELERIGQAYARQLVAAIDMEGKSPFCVSGDTLVDGRVKYVKYVMKPAELPKPSDRDLVVDRARKQYWAKLGLDDKLLQATVNIRPKEQDNPLYQLCTISVAGRFR